MISSLTSRFEFNNRRALFLSAHKAAVYHWRKGDLSSSYLFDVNQEGREYFERYLHETTNTPIYILVDVFEEEYRRETIPHVFGPDREAIINRKQGRQFRDTPYRHYEVLGREEDGRRDDRILLTAITNADVLRPWLALLDKYKVPVAGVNSLPLFTSLLIKQIPEPSEHMLIVSLQSISGLRQSFYQNNEFRISRLVQMPRYGTEPYAPYISGEVDKIRRYINSLRLLDEDVKLDIYFLAEGELLRELQELHTDSGTSRFHFLDINDLLKAAGSAKTASSPFSDQYIVHQLLKYKPANSYANPSDTRYFSMRRLRYSMLVASMLIIMGGAVWSGLTLLDGLTFKQSSIAAQNKTQFYNARYQIARERLPHTPVEPADIKIAVELSDVLDEYKTTPLEMMQLVSFGLRRIPDIQLDSMEWLTSTNPEAQAGNKSRPRSGGNPRSNIAVDPNAPSYKYYQIALIKGHLDPFNGDYRSAMSMINNFAETLRSREYVTKVNVLTLPLDISSDVSLQGSANTEGGDANFSIEVVMGLAKNET